MKLKSTTGRCIRHIEGGSIPGMELFSIVSTDLIVVTYNERQLCIQCYGGANSMGFRKQLGWFFRTPKRASIDPRANVLMYPGTKNDFFILVPVKNLLQHPESTVYYQHMWPALNVRSSLNK